MKPNAIAKSATGWGCTMKLDWLESNDGRTHVLVVSDPVQGLIFTGMSLVANWDGWKIAFRDPSFPSLKEAKAYAEVCYRMGVHK